MDRGSMKGSRLSKKYLSGCACAVANSRRSVVKAATPPPDPTSSSDERVHRREECSFGCSKDSEAKGQRRLHRAAVTDLSCGGHHRKSRRSLGLGCRSIAELGDERLRQEPAEAVVNRKFIDGKGKEKEKEKEKQFMEALCVLNSNKLLFVKLLEDPNSFLAKHIRELRESGENGRKQEARKVGKDEGAGTVSRRKMKIWEKLFRRRSAGSDGDNSREIVVLKPRLEKEPSIGSENGIRAIRQSRFPFGSPRWMRKRRMNVNRTPPGVEAAKLTVASNYIDRESFVRRLHREDQAKVLVDGGSTSTKPGDGLQLLRRSFAESTNIAQMQSRESRSPDLYVDQIELEHIDQTVSSSPDDSFSTSTEDSPASMDGDGKPESPTSSVVHHHKASSINAPLKLDPATSNTPPDKLGRATEFVKSILISSDLSWDSLLPNHDSSNQLLRETCSDLLESGIDTRLLRDYVAEVLGEAIGHRWRSYQQGLVVVDCAVANGLIKRVDWQLMLLQSQESNAKTLESLIARDMTMNPWSSGMRLGEETNEIVIELTRKMVEDVVNEILTVEILLPPR